MFTARGGMVGCFLYHSFGGRMNRFILSVEGPGHIDQGGWSTHKILGAFETREAAVMAIPTTFTEEDLVFITDLVGGYMERIFMEGK